MNKAYRLLLFSLLMTACNSSDKKYSNQQQVDVKEHWYKRYTGTIAGLPVVANLFFDGDRKAKNGIASAGGNYYYRNKSDLLDLEETEISNNKIHFTEYSASDSGDENAKRPAWDVQVNDTAISGTWKSADGSKTYTVSLKENYEHGSYPFDVVSVADSVLFNGKEQQYGMTSEFNLLTPATSISKEDSRFIIDNQLHQLGGDTLGAKDIAGFIKACIKRDFKEYTNEETKLFKDTAAREGSSNNREATTDGTLQYNDRGIVVFSYAMYDFSGGAHPNHYSQYMCLDVADRKRLHLGDILNVDTVQLHAMLEEGARKYFDIKPGIPLGSRLLVDTIPFTENFVISETGITFHYNPYEIASYVDGDSYFYFSYAQLGTMLQPDFRKRMQNTSHL